MTWVEVNGFAQRCNCLVDASGRILSHTQIAIGFGGRVRHLEHLLKSSDGLGVPATLVER